MVVAAATPKKILSELAAFGAPHVIFAPVFGSAQSRCPVDEVGNYCRLFRADKLFLISCISLFLDSNFLFFLVLVSREETEMGVYLLIERCSSLSKGWWNNINGCVLYMSKEKVCQYHASEC